MLLKRLLLNDCYGLHLMRIIILTQDDPFYLGKNIDYLLRLLPSDVHVVGAVVFDVSPFGKRETFVSKIRRTVRVFGFGFFAHYTFRFVVAKIGPYKVKNVLKKHGIPLIQIEGSVNSKDSLRRISDYSPDLLISIAGNQIFKKPLYELARFGCINLHTALLPKYRGLMPSFWVLHNNEKETGVSVFQVDSGIDSGPIIVQVRIPIEGHTQQQLIELTKKIGMEAIATAVRKIHAGEISYIENNPTEMTYYSFPVREDVIRFRKNGKHFY